LFLKSLGFFEKSGLRSSRVSGFSLFPSHLKIARQHRGQAVPKSPYSMIAFAEPRRTAGGLSFAVSSTSVDRSNRLPRGSCFRESHEFNMRLSQIVADWGLPVGAPFAHSRLQVSGSHEVRPAANAAIKKALSSRTV
jgi:hypothetical protein